MRSANYRLWIILAAIASCLPIFIMGLKGHDAANHLIIMREFAWQLTQGDVFPRWLVNAESGFGSPIATYFPPLHYYTGLIFYPLNALDSAFSLPVGYLALFSNAALAMALSGIFMFRYLNAKTSEKTAFMAALVYMFLPYHFGVDLYYRLALSELWLFALLPLFLYYNDKSSTYGTAILTAALILTHTLTAPFIIAIAIAKNLLERRSGQFLPMLIGVGIAAIYWIPAIFNSELVYQNLDSGSHYYEHHFIKLSTIEGSVYAIICGVMALIAIIDAKLRDDANKLWVVVVLGSVFMAFSVSAPLWELFTPLQLLSYPTRLLIFASLGSAILAINHTPGHLKYMALIFIALSVPFIIFIQNADQREYVKHHTLTIDSYMPVYVPQKMVVNGNHKDLSKLRNIKFPKLDVIIKPNKIVAVSDRTGDFLLPQFYFPNWQSRHQVYADEATGLMKIRFNKPGIALIEYKADSKQKTGWYISLFSVIGLYVLNRLTRNRHKIY